MKVLGDARPLTFQRALLLRQTQLALVLSLFDKANTKGDSTQQRHRGESSEPPCLPKTLHHEVVERGRNGHIAEDPAVAATLVAKADLVEGCVRLEPGGEDFGLVFDRGAVREVRAQPHSDQIVTARDILNFEDDDPLVVVTGKFVWFSNAQSGRLRFRRF